MREQAFLRSDGPAGGIGWPDSGSDCLGLRCDDDNFLFGPDREDLSTEFTRLLGAAQEGGSTVAECAATARRIDGVDDTSWYMAWMETADASRVRADAAFARGGVLTARSNWLRAMNYYQAAAFPFDRADANYRSAISRMRECARNYVRNARPRGEVVQIEWPGGYPLEAYFLPAPGVIGRAPAVICFSEPGQHKEEYLYRAAHYAADRGMALLAVDLFGAEADSDFDEIVGRRDLESTVGYAMDYLVMRDDIDETRIAIVSDAMRSSFVARGIAFDERFAAAVCDGGVWDLHERDFLRDRIVAHDPTFTLRPIPSRAARNIKCPVLIPAGERGWLQPERVRQLYESLLAEGRDVTLKMFTTRETAAAQGHADNPTLANEFIFDWIESRLARNSALDGEHRGGRARRANEA